MDDNLIKGEGESVDELITRICKKVDGIGPAIAGAVSSDFSQDLQAFLSANKDRLIKIKKSNGNSLLDDGQITQLIKIKALIPGEKTIQETWVFFLGREFLFAQVKMLEELTFDDIEINPLLAKALELTDPKDIILFNLYQAVTRSVVTSWGDCVETIAKYVGCRENDVVDNKPGTNFDLIKSVNGVDYYIQVKSGPNTMNVGMVTSLNTAIRKIEALKKGSVGMLGMTYGTRKKISAQILGNLRGDPNLRTKVGREFWDFISEQENYHVGLFKLLEASAKGVIGKSFLSLVEDKALAFIKEWHQKYGQLSINDALDNYI